MCLNRLCALWHMCLSAFVPESPMCFVAYVPGSMRLGAYVHRSRMCLNHLCALDHICPGLPMSLSAHVSGLPMCLACLCAWVLCAWLAYMHGLPMCLSTYVPGLPIRNQPFQRRPLPSYVFAFVKTCCHCHEHRTSLRTHQLPLKMQP